MAIKVGIGFFVTGYTIDAVTLAQAVEKAGFDSFWVPDHPVLPTNPFTKYPRNDTGIIPDTYGEFADPFVLLSFIAAATTTLRLATGVTLISERHPLTLAKTVSTLDNFSNGRVILGVGSGWLREEVELYGTDFDHRWAYTREAVLAMKGLWEHGRASFEGKYVNFGEVRCDPIPKQRPWPPVVVGSPPGEVTYNRCARWGDGWLPVMVPPAAVAEGRKAIEAKFREAGRDFSKFETTVFAMDVTPESQRAYEDAGADRLVLGLYNHPGTPLAFEQWQPVRSAALAGGRPVPAETLETLEKIATMAKL